MTKKPSLPIPESIINPLIDVIKNDEREWLAETMAAAGTYLTKVGRKNPNTAQLNEHYAALAELLLRSTWSGNDATRIKTAWGDIKRRGTPMPGFSEISTLIDAAVGVATEAFQIEKPRISFTKLAEKSEHPGVSPTRPRHY